MYQLNVNHIRSVVALALLAGVSTVDPCAARGEVSAEDARRIAIEAYVYGYPLVTMELTRRVMTNVPAPQGSHAPMGQFAHLRAYPSPDNKEVTAPNADTLYSLAWLDLTNEPYILSVPNAHDRYYLLPMLDAWTNVFTSPGKRTTGTAAQKFAIVGPGWNGQLPPGVKKYTAPTNLIWILGRTYCTGTPEDYKAVHAFQDQLLLYPLSAFGKKYTPPGESPYNAKLDMKTAVRAQVNALDAGEYFRLLAQLMRDNPPAEEDAPTIARLARLGIMPGQPFEIEKLGPAAASALKTVPAAAQQVIMARQAQDKLQNGWLFTVDTGRYGVDYVQRALITAIGLGANRPQDAVYPMSEVDADGQPYSGANKYLLHFDKGQTPPVHAFWSLTMYDPAYFFVPNPLNRFTVSPRNALKENADGSVDLYIQHESPGKDKESNWLPAPAGKFILMLRMYWPAEKSPSIINGSWKVPPVRRVP